MDITRKTIKFAEPRNFKRPQVEMMVRSWQHHCIEIREAAQQILLGELGRMGKKGRKQLVESWAQYLPLYTHTEPIAQSSASTTQPSTPGTPVPQTTEPNVISSEFGQKKRFKKKLKFYLV